VPVLADITFKGAPTKAMLWANRNGNFYVLDRNERNVNAEHSGLVRELLIGIICSLATPLILSLLSSNLMSSPKMAALDYLRFFAVVVVFTILLRKLLAPVRLRATTAGNSPPLEQGLNFVDVEILRSVERHPVPDGSLPQLPDDLKLPPGGLVGRVKALIDRGLLATLRVRRQYDELSAALDRQRAENERLREEARRLREDPAAIEELARKELGLIRPGERVFIIRDLKTPPAPGTGSQN